MAIPRKPSARLTLDLKLISGQRLLRFSILKETPTPRQNGKVVFGQEWQRMIVKGRLPIDKSRIRRILVRGTNWIGDVVMSLPSLEAVRDNFPGRKISVLAKPWVAPLYESHPVVDEVIHYHRATWSPGDLAEMVRTARRLRHQNFDLAILFQNAFEAALLTFLAGIRYRVGYNTDARGFLLSHSIPRDPEVMKQHQVEYYLSILRPMGWEAPAKEPVVYVAPKDEETIEKLLASYGINRHDFLLGLSPGATYGPAKRWPTQRFAVIGDWAAERWGAKVVLMGSEAEKKLGKALSQEMKQEALDLSGMTTLGEAMALIKRSRFFICNDSGLMHAAAALNVPTVAIFGSTDAVATGPRGNCARMVWEKVECSPCLEPECRFGHYRCMLDITPERVWEELEHLRRIVDTEERSTCSGA
jgi:heptosyltransferase-2